jgi:hypothetical protein
MSILSFRPESAAPARTALLIAKEVVLVPVMGLAWIAFQRALS